MSATNQPPGDWPWDWDFRNNDSYSRGRSFRRQDSCSRSSSILSDCLSEASRRHEEDASLSRSASISSQMRSPSTSQLDSLWALSWPMRSSSYDGSTETTSLSEVDMWLSEAPGRVWTGSSLSSPSNLACPTCKKSVNTESELKKHELRHRKPFSCTVYGCTRIEGFSTTNDLDRHMRSKHPSVADPRKPHMGYVCLLSGCKAKGKTWPRQDNFRSHLKRVHHRIFSNGGDVEEVIKKCMVEVVNGRPQVTDYQRSVTAMQSLPVLTQSCPGGPSPIAVPQPPEPIGPSSRAGNNLICEQLSLSILEEIQTNNILPMRSTTNLEPGWVAEGSPTSIVDAISSTLSANVCTKSTTEQGQKAKELLKSLHDLGYIVKKDQSKRPSDPTSSHGLANKQQDNLVTCQLCDKFKGRPCELKKHMKRHDRPYGCTFPTCSKTFGSKNDWKRHENSQHFHLETWRCNIPLEHGICGKISYREQSFRSHLSTDHDMQSQEAIKQREDECRIGRNCQKRFWCGFCRALVDLKSKALAAWTERFDHIDDHFMGRNGCTKRGIEKWMPINIEVRPREVLTQRMELEPPTDSPTAHTGHAHHRGRKRKTSPPVQPQRNFHSDRY